jgi:hypothetical protein
MNASLQIILTQVQKLKSHKTTKFRRYLAGKVVVAKVQLSEIRQVPQRLQARS